MRPFLSSLFLTLLCQILTSEAKDSLASDGDTYDTLVRDEDSDDAEVLSKPVLHASLIILENVENDCALRTSDKKYPLRFAQKSCT